MAAYLIRNDGDRRGKMKQKYANTSNENLNIPMTVEQWDIVNFIAFESETAFIYPFAIEFNDITMEKINNIVEACSGHTNDTETVYAVCEKILGVNPVLENAR